MTRQPTKTLDITPTWSSILPVLLTAYSDHPPSMALVEGELKRMAQLADLYVEHQEKEQEAKQATKDAAARRQAQRESQSCETQR